MKDVYPKFIIEDNIVKIGKCTFHKEMCDNKKNVIGGGWYHILLEEKILYFYDRSMDFGTVTFEQLQEAKKNGAHRKRLTKLFTDYEWRFSEESSYWNATKNYKIVE